MTKVLAAIDNSAAARPVLATALVVAPLFSAEVEAVHVREDGDRNARAAAEAADVPLREIPGPRVASLVAEGQADEVAALVLGVRGSLVGRRPAGRTALELIVALRKPLVVVPPHAVVPPRLERVLVPLDATAETTAALADTIELACGAGIEVVALHVHDRDTLLRFDDQPQHELDAWRREFLARHCPRPQRARLEVRVGAPGRHVVAVAGDQQADLVVLGWAQDLSAGHATVVREVLGHSDVPVLLLPIDREEAEGARPSGSAVGTMG